MTKFHLLVPAVKPFGEDADDGDPDDGDRPSLALSCDLEVLSVFRHGMRNFKLACSARC
jgi:hypothetical protein